MPAKVDYSGGIETICQDPGALSPGATAKLVFRAWDDVTPPVTVKVKGPDGKILLDRVVRELPTGSPQSGPPVTFLAPAAGTYHVHVKELYGQVEGSAKVTVS